ncbi:Heparanase-like protein 1 [Platanthera guangdongensis]|uniref:Heparanase-like protein 1 n=1 Tax=Platanthera guangdongensis TaxID=2320717 RepID=A0ABR2LJW3_9ASPA
MIQKKVVNIIPWCSAVVTFGLNALHGRHYIGHGVWGGAWNSTNARDFIRYTVSKGYPVDSWEFGNELSGHGIGASVDAKVYGGDLIGLKSVLDDLYKNISSKPLLLAPGGFYERQWYAQLLESSGSGVVDAVTHHIYNLGGGEAGGAFNSGGRFISNTFLNSFWYLDQLGMASKFNTKAYCRQTLIGGNYGLLDTKTFIPNPDYYRLARISLVLINLSNSTEFRIRIQKEMNGTNSMECETRRRSLFPWFEEDDTLRWNGIIRQSEQARGVSLTAKDGNLRSRTMLLNGRALQLTEFGQIPDLVPSHVDDDNSPILASPLSIVFAVIPGFDVKACP